MLPEALDLRKLRAFQLAARHGGLRVAAVRLGLTTSAVSFQIKRLEEELGTTLFQRLPSGFALTRSGETLLREASAIFDRVENALTAVASDDGYSGQISISTSSDIVWYFTPRISSFIKRYPKVQLRQHVYNSVQTLALVSSGDIDLGFGYFTRTPRTLVRETITRSGLSLVCMPGHPLQRRRSLRLEDIAPYKMILLPQQSSTRKIIDQVFNRSGIKLREVIEVGSCQTARDFVENDVGIAIVHSLCVGHRSSSRLRYIDVSAQFGTVDFSAVYRKESARSVEVQGLLEQLTKHSVP